MARCKGLSRLRRLACSSTAAPRQYPPHTSRLKTVRRTVFLTSLTLSGFESQLVYKQKRNRFCDSFFRGALQGTQSAAQPCVLGDRRPAAVPASHFAAKNSPPDCFLNAAHPLRVRVPLAHIRKKGTAHAIPFSVARCKGLEPLTFWFVAKHSIQLS